VPSENRLIARAAGTVAALTLASRITGLVRDAVMSHVFGAGVAADAFFVAFRLPNLLRRLVGEGAASVAFIPVFGAALHHGGRTEANRAFRTVVTGFALLLAALTVVGIAVAPFWVRILAPGFGDEPEVFALTVRLTRWLFPYLLLVGLVAALGGYLNALRHFAAPAAAPVLLNLSMIAAVLAMTPFGQPTDALVLGVLVGGALQVGAQILALRARAVDLRPLWAPREPALRRVLALLAPSTLGAAVYQINILINTSLASALPVGSVSYLWYSGRVLELPIGLVAVALGTAALPSFAAQAARGAHHELRRSLGFAIGLTNMIAVPATVALVVLALPITAVLFQHGAFSAADAERTAGALRAYALGLWPLAVARLVVPALYAVRDVRAPLLAAAAAVTGNVLASLALIGALPGAAGTGLAAGIARAAAVLSVAELGAAGLALAASLAAAVNLACLLPALRRHLGGLDGSALAASGLRSLLASLPMGVLVHAAAGGIDWTAAGGLGFKALFLAAIVGAGLAAFAGTALAVGGPEVDALRRLLRERSQADW
jgi:putative peptidoglycan lipid II flippase